jgi:octopine/nopaline transport system substrate-binding protein
MVKALEPKLKGATMGVQVSTIQAATLEQFFKGMMDVRTYGKTEEHDLDLQDGRLDIEMASSNYFVSVLGKPGGDKIVLTGPLMTGGPLGHGSAVGLRKSDTDLKAMFDAAIRAAKADGTLKTLALKWFHNDIVPTSWN